MSQLLDESVIRVLNTNGETVGTGFVVADNLAITCAHVVKAACGKLATTISIRFYQSKENLDAQVLTDSWSPPEVDDVAFLYLSATPDTARPLKLASASSSALHPYTSLGFPKQGDQATARRPSASINGLVPSEGKRDRLELKGEEMYYGMSGAPIYDLVLDRVVGMVTSHKDELHTRIVYATTTDTMLFYLPSLVFSEPDELVRYREQLLRETQYVSFTGIPLPTDRQGREIVPMMLLEKVYIRLQTIEDQNQREREAKERRELEEKSIQALNDVLLLGEYLYQRSYVQENQYQTTIDPQEALQKDKKIVILGAPGSGKSTLLRWLARQAITDVEGCIPILILLREYASAHQIEPTLSLREFALRRTAQGDSKLRTSLEKAIQSGKVIWLVDALDEARLSSEQAAREAANLPGQVLLTSRPIGFTSIGLEDLPKYQILPLSVKDVNDFVSNWFETLTDSMNQQKIEKTDWVEGRKNWLKTQLDQRPQLIGLKSNPLLLTFLATLSVGDPLSPLPETRADLYATFIDRLFNTWEGRNVSREIRRLALSGFILIGWVLHFIYYAGKPDQEPTRAVLSEKLKKYKLDGWKNPEEQQVEDVINFWQRAGVLEIWNLGQLEYLAFRHLTFQEYAAGQTLKLFWESDPKRAWIFLRPRLHVPAWREIILLMFSLLSDIDQSHFIRLVLHAGSKWEKDLRRDLQLAIRMVCEVKQPSNNLITPLSQAVKSVLTSKGDKEGYRKAWVKGQIIDAFQPPGSEWKYEILRESLKCNNPFVLEKAVINLGRLGEVDSVLGATKHEDWYIRKSAIKALESLSQNTVAPLKVREILLGILNDKDEIYDVRDVSIHLLKKINDIEALRQLLKSTISENRWLAINELAILKDLESIPAIRQALEDEDYEVRGGAAWALGELGDRESIPALRNMLWDDSEFARKSVAEALIELDDIYGIREALRSESDNVREAASAFLGGIGDRELVLQAANDRNKQVRNSAVYAMFPMKDRELLWQAMKDKDTDIRWTAISMLFALKDPYLMSLFEKGLQAEDLHLRFAFANLMVRMGHNEALPVLQKALKEGDEEDRWSAAVLLGEHGYEEAIPILIMMVYKTKDSKERASAIESLGKLGNIKALPVLRHAIEDSEADVRSAARHAIQLLTDKAKSLSDIKQIEREIKYFDSPEALNLVAERLAVKEVQSQSACDLLINDRR